ncbi:MAG: MMPL family transporter [Planctomycetaceae bacterium]
MYYRLGQVVVRYAAPIVLGWVGLLVLLILTAPSWRSVTKDGEFAFLPADSQSQQAAEIYQQAFPTSSGMKPLDSNIVIVVHREDRPTPREGMAVADFEFIEEQIVPMLRKIALTTGKGYEPLTPAEQAQPRAEIPASERIVTNVYTRPSNKGPTLRGDDDVIGALMESDDQRASLVYVELNSEMLDRSNNLIISEVERLIINNPELLRHRPGGLALDLSGTAVVGRDVLGAEQQSASRTESLTQWLVVVLLLLIYRAPLLALIPLVTVGLSVHMTLRVLALLAGWDWIGVFTGLEVYVTVVVYGAGVDYCLFLIARYREELDQGRDFSEAIQSAVGHVGAALATSAGTSIFGIGMMAFADFGKFSQAGIAISLGLTIVLLLAVSFTPALLLLCGRWAFWPDLRRERLEAGGGWLPTLRLSKFIHEQEWLDRGWQFIARKLRLWPAAVFVGTCAALLPLAVVGFSIQNHLNYGLLTDLPQDDPSVLGARAVQKHFPSGVSGPIVILVQHPDLEIADSLRRGLRVSTELVARLRPRMAELGIADVRCQGYPLGLSAKADQVLQKTFSKGSARRMLVAHARRIYASTKGPLAGQVMRLDLILNQDPFARESIEQLASIELAIQEAIQSAATAPPAEVPDGGDLAPEPFPPELAQGARVYAMGPTANLRDLKLVTDRDRVLIDILVVVVVYLLLVLLLRQPAICAYLLVTVVFSYLVTLGATYLVFWYSLGENFAGLDWKIPLFLFTILIAIGEDYNILLMARVTEEQQRHGLIEGVLVALTKTGSIISSCGVIMAGTFASLMTGTLLGMVEMGFALAFGVLLDTFVVRPILVPAYLILLYSGRFGRLSPWLGAPATVALESASPEVGPPPPTEEASAASPENESGEPARHGELTSN